MNPIFIEACARAAHEANRAYCLAIGDTSQPSWEDAPEWQRNSAMNGVQGVVAGNGPRESHEGWLREKAETGWKYGAVKDPEKKEHPCFVPYDELPEAQKAKDAIFITVVRVVGAPLGLFARERGDLRLTEAEAAYVVALVNGAREETGMPHIDLPERSPLRREVLCAP